MEDKNYGWTVEMQIKAAEQQLKIREIGLPYYRRDAGKIKGKQKHPRDCPGRFENSLYYF